MKQKILLFCAAMVVVSAIHAQKKSEKITAYAITGSQKGQFNWDEVRLVDIETGDELQTIYKSKQEIPILNARTKKTVELNQSTGNAIFTSSSENSPGHEGNNTSGTKKKSSYTVKVYKGDANGNMILVNSFSSGNTFQGSNNPFATKSAACAYDKKHNRLYYTPMGINQLRYIDLKSKTHGIYYFENENFGPLKNRADIPNQITRMVIASDGNGYALTNDANHLIQFTTGKKPVISDLGALTDDPSNGRNSIHSSSGYGGDIVADKNKNIYLVTANRRVFRISLETKVAIYLGNIQGLPTGYTTNGAVVDKGSTIIVTSSTSTLGYFKVDINTLQAEKISTGASVFNASDLANGNLLFDKKKKEKNVKKQVKEMPAEQIVETITEEEVVEDEVLAGRPSQPEIIRNSISIYPNPVTTGMVKLAFSDQPEGRYQIQFMDISGKIIGSEQVTISNKTQVVEYILPHLTASGNYLMKVVNEKDKSAVIRKLVVKQ